jgi:hypothetical protein
VSSTAALRTLLADRFPDAVLLPDRAVPPVPTGLAVLDGLLPGGGLPAGRLAAWQGAAGATALLRAAAGGILARGERVAWVDGARSLGAQWTDGPLLVRPATPDLALRAAEILLRSGGFALVVLSGVQPDPTAVLRLSRMAHEGGGAGVAVAARPLAAGLRLVSRYLPAGHRCAPGPSGEPARIDTVALRLEARASGWRRHVTLHLPLAALDFRMALEPGLPDRRGAAP